MKFRLLAVALLLAASGIAGGAQKNWITGKVLDSRAVKTNQYRIDTAAASNRHRGCRFIVGDDVKFWQEKAILYVIDADGKECKVEVLRQERLTKDVSPQPPK